MTTLWYWKDDPRDIRDRLNEIDACINRATLGPSEMEQIQIARRKLHDALITVQLAEFNRE